MFFKRLLFIILMPFTFILFLLHFLLDFIFFFIGAICFDDPIHSPVEDVVCKYYDFILKGVFDYEKENS